jgi:hypothetical protein
MPPQVEWRDGIGLRARWDEVDTVVEPHWYSFVEERHFPARDLDRRLELPARNVTLLRETERATDYAAIENRIINRSVNVERIERVSGRAVLRQRVVDSGSAGRGVEVRGGDVIFYRPRIEREKTDRAPRQVETPRRTPNPTAEQIRRREEAEQRRLETQQSRERQTLENRQRIERTRPPAPPEEINRRHENERRALEEQMRREKQILQGRQEERRKVEPRRRRPLEKRESENPRLKENRRRSGNHRSFAARARSPRLFMNRKPNPKTQNEIATQPAQCISKKDQIILRHRHCGNDRVRRRYEGRKKEA